MADEAKPSERMKKLMQEFERSGLRVKNMDPLTKSIGIVGGIAPSQRRSRNDVNSRLQRKHKIGSNT